MASVKRNIIANYAGSFWSALMGLAFVPLYIKFMGIEAYGLVGFFGTLVSLFSILDMGLSVTLSREMARRSSLTEQEATTRDLLRTIETIYWGVAVIIGAAVIMLSFPIARYWVNPEKLTIADVQQAVMIMGLVVVLRWPFGMYQGGLMGLQRQVLVNIITSISATLRGLGAVAVLIMVSSTIQAFFMWQIVVSGAETFTMAACLWHSLPKKNQKATFKKEILGEVWHFAAGMTGIAVVSTVLTLTDKIVLSKMLTLEMFGYYTLAWTVAGALNRMAGPIVSALFPRFSQLVPSGDVKGLTTLYHKSCQIMSVIIMPISAILALFSYEVLSIWTGDPLIAQQTCLVLSVLIIGTAGNAMMNMPFALQLAYGWITLALWVNVVGIVILIPLLIWLVSLYGMLGGAVVWALLNTGYVLIAIRIMHMRILKGELWHWYLKDLGSPLLSAMGVGILARIFMPRHWSSELTVFCLVIVTGLGIVAAALSVSGIRADARYYLSCLAKAVTKRVPAI